MGEFLAVTCDSCGEPMVPNVSTLDDDGCGWICLNPGCPELAAGELEAEDLVEAGVSTVWGTGSDVEAEALAADVARVLHVRGTVLVEVLALRVDHEERYPPVSEVVEYGRMPGPRRFVGGLSR